MKQKLEKIAWFRDKHETQKTVAGQKSIESTDPDILAKINLKKTCDFDQEYPCWRSKKCNRNVIIHQDLSKDARSIKVSSIRPKIMSFRKKNAKISSWPVLNVFLMKMIDLVACEQMVALHSISYSFSFFF